MRVAGSGTEALTLIGQTIPDIVISDVMMPGLSGYGLLEALRRNPAWQGLPVVLMSAAARPTTAAFRPDAYLAKPFDIDSLLAVVERLGVR